MRQLCFARWNSHSAAVRAKHKLPKNSSPWTSRPQTQLRGVSSSARVEDTLNVAFSIARNNMPPESKTSDVVKDLFCDFSQGIQRRPWGAMKTFCTSSMPYSFEGNRLISGYGGLRALGWPESCLDPAKTSMTMARDLCGDAFSLPNAAQVMFAVYGNPHAPWWRK
jgi:hypothetical protein